MKTYVEKFNRSHNVQIIDSKEVAIRGKEAHRDLTKY
jgi:hypothetical protein